MKLKFKFNKSILVLTLAIGGLLNPLLSNTNVARFPIILFAQTNPLSAQVTQIQEKSKSSTKNNAKPAPQIKILVNGKQQTLSDPIIMDNGRVFLPVRALGNLLGISVDYMDTDKVATATNSTAHLELPLGYNEAVKDRKLILPVDTNNKETRITTYKSRTYLPVRFISENLGYQISYANQTVSITTDGSTPIIPEAPTDEVVDGWRDVSGMNPADKNNPHNLNAFKDGRSMSQIPTVPFNQITPPEGLQGQALKSYKEMNPKIVMATGKLSDIPTHLNYMRPDGSESSSTSSKVSPITVDPKTGALSSKRADTGTEIRFKDGSVSRVHFGDNASTGVIDTKDGMKYIKGKTFKDISFISVSDSQSGGYYWFFPTAP